jgi:predicted kinase
MKYLNNEWRRYAWFSRRREGLGESLELPATVRMCYKPYMRKWMREKLKRRKKSSEEAGTQPAPLQPAYFEPETKAAEPSAPAPVELPREEPAIPVARDTSTRSQPDQGGAATRENARPRRRRRGGRGRRGSGRQSQPQPAQPAAAATATAATITQAPPQGKGVVVLAVGLPGSGKSTWFKRHNVTPLSSDMIRVLLFDDPTEQRFQDLVFSTLRTMLRARLIAHRPMNHVDATNLTPQERQNWIKLAKNFGYDVHAVFFDVPLEVCIERHQRRDRLVPEDVMRKMAAKLKPPSFDEGFSKITVVRVKQKTGENAEL